MYTVAVAGATGAVGEVMLEVLAERDFPVERLVPLASERSRGRTVSFRGDPEEVRVLSEHDFEDVDLVLFSAGSDVVRREADRILESGAVIVDNSSAYRYDPDVPLVVPEVNPGDLEDHQGLVANPNCSTIQMVMALAPLHRAFGIQRVVVSTYQSTSGAGARARREMWDQIEAAVAGDPAPEPDAFPHAIAFNAIPEIGPVLEDHDDYTKEEMKMVWETRKILGDDSLEVSPTAVRIPVETAHGESVNVQTARPCPPDEARRRLEEFPGVDVLDDPERSVYPTMLQASDRDPVYVGRIRRDPTLENGLNLWIVADNLRKGAALNTVQIAETLVEEGLLAGEGASVRA